MMRQKLKSLQRQLGACEDGNMLLLGTGVCAVVLALAFVIASATAVQLDYKRLLSMADIAAAEAANSMDSDYYYAHAEKGAGALGIENAALRDAAIKSVNSQSASESLSGIRVAAAHSVDSDVVYVTLQAHSQPPFLPWGLINADGFTLTVTSSAQLDSSY